MMEDDIAVEKQAVPTSEPKKSHRKHKKKKEANDETASEISPPKKSKRKPSSSKTKEETSPVQSGDECQKKKHRKKKKRKETSTAAENGDGSPPKEKKRKSSSSSASSSSLKKRKHRRSPPPPPSSSSIVDSSTTVGTDGDIDTIVAQSSATPDSLLLDQHQNHFNDQSNGKVDSSHQSDQKSDPQTDTTAEPLLEELSDDPELLPPPPPPPPEEPLAVSASIMDPLSPDLTEKDNRDASLRQRALSDAGGATTTDTTTSEPALSPAEIAYMKKRGMSVAAESGDSPAATDPHSNTTGQKKPMTLVPIKPQTVEEKKKKRFTIFNRKKKEPMEIGIVTGFKHEGHVGFDEKAGGFQTSNLPPQYERFFAKLDSVLKKMGVDGIRKEEVGLLLKKLPEEFFNEEKRREKQKSREQGPGESLDDSPSSAADQSSISKPTASLISYSLDELRAMIQQKDVETAAIKSMLTQLVKSKQEIATDLSTLKAKLLSETNENSILRQRNTELELQIASHSIVLSHSSTGDDSSTAQAIRELQSSIGIKLQESVSKLEEEQRLASSLYSQVQELRDQKSSMETELEKLRERLRQFEAGEVISSGITASSFASGSAPSPPPPPPPTLQSVPTPPPPPPPANLNLGSATGPSPVKETLNFSSVQLKKAEVVSRTADKRDNLLVQIQQGTALKKVEPTEKKKKDDDDSMLNVIARALISRRNRIEISGDDDEDLDVNWDDEDW